MAQVVRYTAGDDNTEVRFEIDPPAGFRPVAAGEIAGRVRDAVQPVVEAARDLLHDLKALHPDEVEVKFGIKVSGTANWLVARAASEGNFEVTVTWRSPENTDPDKAPASPAQPDTPQPPDTAAPAAQDGA
jgi:Trypsin-co-occurring domain 1